MRLHVELYHIYISLIYYIYTCLDTCAMLFSLCLLTVYWFACFMQERELENTVGQLEQEEQRTEQEIQAEEQRSQQLESHIGQAEAQVGNPSI